MLLCLPDDDCQLPVINIGQVKPFIGSIVNYDVMAAVFQPVFSSTSFFLLAVCNHSSAPLMVLGGKIRLMITVAPAVS